MINKKILVFVLFGVTFVKGECQSVELIKYMEQIDTSAIYYEYMYKNTPIAELQMVIDTCNPYRKYIIYSAVNDSTVFGYYVNLINDDSVEWFNSIRMFVFNPITSNCAFWQTLYDPKEFKLSEFYQHRSDIYYFSSERELEASFTIDDDPDAGRIFMTMYAYSSNKTFSSQPEKIQYEYIDSDMKSMLFFHRIESISAEKESLVMIQQEDHKSLVINKISGKNKVEE